MVKVAGGDSRRLFDPPYCGVLVIKSLPLLPLFKKQAGLPRSSNFGKYPQNLRNRATRRTDYVDSSGCGRLERRIKCAPDGTNLTEGTLRSLPTSSLQCRQKLETAKRRGFQNAWNAWNARNFKLLKSSNCHNRFSRGLSQCINNFLTKNVSQSHTTLDKSHKNLGYGMLSKTHTCANAEHSVNTMNPFNIDSQTSNDSFRNMRCALCTVYI